jgi:hypothetical protein
VLSTLSTELVGQITMFDEIDFILRIVSTGTGNHWVFSLQFSYLSGVKFVTLLSLHPSRGSKSDKQEGWLMISSLGEFAEHYVICNMRPIQTDVWITPAGGPTP